MAAAAREEVSEYAAVRDPAFAREVVAHAEDHVRAFVAAGRAGRPPAGAELDFVRERGARRARELLPLDALLEAYLVGQRVVWESIVEAAGAGHDGLRIAQELTGFTFRYTHAINAAVTAAYLRESTALASEAERGRRDLVDRLLSGREPGAEEQRRAEALGLAPQADHAVVVAAPAGAGGERATGLVVRALTRQEPSSAFVVARHGEVLAVMPVYVRRGPSAIAAELGRMAEGLARSHGVGLRAGVSSVCAGLADIPRGYSEAHSAWRQAGPDAPVVALAEIPLFDHLAAGADEAARRLILARTAALAQADARQGGALAATLRAYADADLNVARAAQRLVVHPNTVHYRLRRVEALTGRDPRRFADLVELIAALRLLDRGFAEE